MKRRAHLWRWPALAALLILTLALRPGSTPEAHASRPAHAAAGHWIASWGAAPQPPTPGNLSRHGFRAQTLRQIVYTSIGGSGARIEVTNAFGHTPLVIGGASIALAGRGAAVVPGSLRRITFGGQPSVLVPPGAEAVSDAAALPVHPLQRLAVSLYLPAATGPATQHAVARELSFVASGDRVTQPESSGFGTRTTSWYLLDAVDVRAAPRVLGAVVALGDSITDGVGSTLGGENRWPTLLARRLDARPGASLAVLDEGIGGNRLLSDPACCGVNAVARFGRDVRDRAGVRAVIVLEGVNDITAGRHTGRATAPHADVSAGQLIAGLQQLATLAHAGGLRIFAATITPFRGGRYWSPAGEAKREAVNAWIRTGRAFDGVIDFDRVLADPQAPQALRTAYDSGDHLHPNPAGYRRMASAVNLAAVIRAAR